MRKVLIITFHFPPQPQIASVRLGGLAKYLPEFGWEPIVLTTSLPGEPSVNARVIQTPYRNVIGTWKERFGFRPDEGFQRQMNILPFDTDNISISDSVIKWINKRFKELVAYPDYEKGWYPFAVKESKDLLQREKIDAIVSSSDPKTSHLIAKALKVEHRNIPWVADLRDLWTQNHDYKWSFPRRVVEKRLELRTLMFADALVTVSEPLTKKLASLHRSKLIYSITNGYDPEDFVEELVPLTGKFTVTYTGRIYVGKQDLALFLAALQELISYNHIDSNDVVVRLFCPGILREWLESQIESCGLGGVVKHYDVIPRNDALKKQRESQLLLLLNWIDPSERGIYPGKIFEYLAAQRPILSLGGPGGVVEGLLKETNAGIHCSTKESIQEVLLKCYAEYKSTGKVSYNGIGNKIERYSHPNMACKFASVLEKVSST